MELLMLEGWMLGAIALASIVAGLFFLRFYGATGDRLFVFFALAFFFEALSRVLMAVSTLSSDEHPVIYVIRLIAYGLIIAGISYKNFKKPSRAPIGNLKPN